MTIILAIIFILTAGAASADPVSAAIISGFGITSTIGIAAVQIGVSLAVSRLASAIGRSKIASAKDPGVKTQATTAGGMNSQSTILGRYSTAGNLVAPPMTHGKQDNGKAPDTPNSILTHVIDVSDMPITAFVKVVIDDESLSWPQDFEATISDNLGYKCKAGIYTDKLYFDPQINPTAANPRLTAIYGSRSERPWDTGMIGRGLSYAALHFRYDTKIFRSEPTTSFVVDGIPLYDPRKDSSVGGNGTQRWGNKSTWQLSNNPKVMIYNLMRGITVGAGIFYGLSVSAEDLPLDSWAASMNKCDEQNYTAGLEILFAQDEPLDVIDELLKACDGDVADVGGEWFSTVGLPSLPVAFIHDDDLLYNKPTELDPFPPMKDTYNAVNVSFIDPGSKWQEIETPPRYDLEAEAEDGRRLTGEVSLKAVTNKTQAQRLGRAWLLDARRMRKHTISLGPEGMLINPLDHIQWTSARNGYIAKRFDVAQATLDPNTLAVSFSIRERNPDDYDWNSSYIIPSSSPSAVQVIPASQTLPQFAVMGYVIGDNDEPRRPALMLSWDGELPDCSAIRWEVRVAATLEVIAVGSTHDVTSGRLIVSNGIVANLEYQARARMIVDRDTSWTVWTGAVSPDVKFGTKDLAPGTVTIAQLAADALAEIARIDARADAIQAEILDNLASAQDEFSLLRNDLEAAQLTLGISISGLQTRVSAAETGITSETSARTTADLSLSGRIDTAVSRIGTSEAAIASESATRASADTAIAGTVTAVTARVGTAEGAITAEQTARANADSAIVGTANALTTRVGAAEGAITSEATTRSNADSALSGRVDTVDAAYKSADTTIRGTVTAEATARANADSALSSTINSVNARVGASEAEVSTLQAAYATTDGKVRAMLGLRAVTTGTGGSQRVASIRLTSYSDPNGSGGTAIQMDADNVLVERTLSANRLIAKTITAASGAIGDFAVDTLQIAGEAVTAANFGSRNSGIIVNSSGWTDICSVNLNCGNDFDVFAVVSASTQAINYVGIDVVGLLEFRLTHQGNSFGSFFETKEVDIIQGASDSQDRKRVSASDECMAFMKTSPGNGVKTFKLQAATNGDRDRVVLSGLIRVQMVKR